MQQRVEMPWVTLGTVGATGSTQAPMDGDPKPPWGGEAGGDLPSWRPPPCHRGWGWKEGDQRGYEGLGTISSWGQGGGQVSLASPVPP